MADHDSLQLIEAARSGDNAALDGLLRRHLKDLRVFVRAKSGARLRAKESCSDLVQTVCREALGSLDQYEWRGEGSFRHWLFTLAIHKIRNRADYYAAARRDAAREQPSDSRDAALARAYASGFGPSQHAMAREAVATFERCLDQLTDDQREIVLLSRVVGLQHREIADQLEITEGAVRTRLSRALARLATLMTE